MSNRRQNQIIIIFIVASLVLHAAFFGVASQYDFSTRPEKPEKEKPRTITLRRIEEPKPEPPKPKPEPAQEPKEQLAQTHQYQETDEPVDPNTRYISDKNTKLQTTSRATTDDRANPEMKSDANPLTQNNFMNLTPTPNAQQNKLGQQLEPEKNPDKQRSQAQQAQPTQETAQKESEKKAENPSKEKPVESEVTEKFEKVKDPQKGKAEEATKLAMANPNEVPLREVQKKDYAPDAMPLLPPDPRREEARPLTKVEDPEKQKQVQPQKETTLPTLSLNEYARKFDIRGGGERGQFDSRETRATAEGRYVSKMYGTIRSYWNRYRSQIHDFEIDRRDRVLVVEFTLRPNGVVSDARIIQDDSGGRNRVGGEVMIKAIRNAAPFDVFPRVMKDKYPDGVNFTCRITFTGS